MNTKIYIWKITPDMIRLVVFDMAGTTVNEDNVVYKTLQRAINEFGFNFSLAQY